MSLDYHIDAQPAPVQYIERCISLLDERRSAQSRYGFGFLGSCDSIHHPTGVTLCPRKRGRRWGCIENGSSPDQVEVETKSNKTFREGKSLNLNSILCADCKKKIKLAKRSEKCLKKLKTRKDATYSQKQSWKYHIAKAMKYSPTPAEAMLKRILDEQGKQQHWSLSYQRQIGPYIVDACIVNRSIVIEVDGAVHLDRQQYDAARDRFLKSKGYTVLRFPNATVMTRWPEVISRILQECHES